MRGMQWSIEVEKTMRQIARSDGKRETGDPGKERGRREETEMDDKADVRGEREIGERHPAEVVSMDIPVSFVLAFIVPSRTLRFERRREGEAAGERRRVSRNRHEKYPGRMSRAERRVSERLASCGGMAPRERGASPEIAFSKCRSRVISSKQKNYREAFVYNYCRSC